MTKEPGDEFVGGMVFVALLGAVLVLASGFAFGWGDALDLLKFIGIALGAAILVRLLGRGLPRIVRVVLMLALGGLAIGLVLGWEDAETFVVAAGVVAIWQLWSERDEPADGAGPVPGRKGAAVEANTRGLTLAVVAVMAVLIVLAFLIQKVFS
jgi:hypothetical protein